MLFENQKVAVCCQETFTSWAKRTSLTRMRHVLEETRLA